MSGQFTRKMYDGCAIKQDLDQSTSPLELILDANKYVHCGNICKPTNYHPESAQLVDVESSLWGIDKTASRCDEAKHPFCGSAGCMLTRDQRAPAYSSPYLCERGRPGDHAVVTTNMQVPSHPGYRVPNANICDARNGYYYNPNQNQKQVSDHDQLAGFFKGDYSRFDPYDYDNQVKPMNSHQTVQSNGQHQLLAPVPGINGVNSTNSVNTANTVQNSNGLYTRMLDQNGNVIFVPVSRNNDNINGVNTQQFARPQQLQSQGPSLNWEENANHLNQSSQTGSIFQHIRNQKPTSSNQQVFNGQTINRQAIDRQAISDQWNRVKQQGQNLVNQISNRQQAAPLVQPFTQNGQQSNQLPKIDPDLQQMIAKKWGNVQQTQPQQLTTNQVQPQQAIPQYVQQQPQPQQSQQPQQVHVTVQQPQSQQPQIQQQQRIPRSNQTVPQQTVPQQVTVQTQIPVSSPVPAHGQWHLPSLSQLGQLASNIHMPQNLSQLAAEIPQIANQFRR